jgi:hypothetical protein
VRIKIRVTPKSRADAIVGLREDGVLHIRVSAAPEGGKANDAVLRLLCSALGLPKRAVRIAGGVSSRDKWIELDGIDAEGLSRRLETDRT